MPAEQIKTQVLLLHSEQSTLDRMSASFGEHYTVHCATSGVEALNTLGETPIHVIVSANALPGMSGAEALREAKKRSPETVGILIAGNDDPKIDASAGDRQLFQVIRGGVEPQYITQLVEAALQEFKNAAGGEAANDRSAAEATGHHPVAPPKKAPKPAQPAKPAAEAPPKQAAAAANDAGKADRPQQADVLVMTKDGDFLDAVRKTCNNAHAVHVAGSIREAGDMLASQPIGVAVIDASLVGPNIEKLLAHLQSQKARLVPVVAGRREDGDTLIDLINRGKAYRFILKPASPGRLRLALEASVRHHLDGSAQAFAKPAEDSRVAEATGRFRALATAKAGNETPAADSKPERKAPPVAAAKEADKAAEKPAGKKAEADAKPKPKAEPRKEPPKPAPAPRREANLDGVFDEDDHRFAETVKGIVEGTQGLRIESAGAGLDATADTPAWMKPAMIGGVAVAVIAALALWMFSGDEDAVPTAAPETATVAADEQPEASTPEPAPLADATGDSTPPPAVADAGNEPVRPAQADPPAETGVETTTAATADNEPAIDPVDAVDVAPLIADIEMALLEGRLEDARSGVDEVRLSQPGNDRLPFLVAQLEQAEIRRALDMALVAVREQRYPDAAAALADARSLGADDAAIRPIQQEIDEARSSQRVSQVLAIANTRLAQGFLVEPAGDNARYLFQLVLSNEPDNMVARQGLATIASRLVLNARTAIDAGRTDEAEELLKQAAEINSGSAELDAAWQALAASRQAAAEPDEPARVASAGDASPADDTETAPADKAAEASDEPVSISSLTRTRYVAPRYPRSAERRGVNGWVDVVFTVQRNGSVRDVEVRDSKPANIFDSAAADAVERWEFEPIVENGEIVEKTAAVRLMFAVE